MIRKSILIVTALLLSGNLLARPVKVIKPISPQKIVSLKPSCENPSDVGKLFGDEVCDAKVSKWKKCTSDNPHEIIGAMLCDPKDDQWQKCDSNQHETYGSYGCDFDKWIKCDDSTFKKVVKNDSSHVYTCSGDGAWLSNIQMTNIKQSAPSFFKVKETDDKWVHYGDGGEWSNCDKAGKLELPVLNFYTQYTIGSKMEMMAEVKEVSNNPKYPTEVEIDGKKNWPIESLLKNLGALAFGDEKVPGGGVFGTALESEKEVKGFLLETFDTEKLNNKGIGSHTIEFDVGKESFSCPYTGLSFSGEEKPMVTTNYDDFDVRDFFIKTGVVYDGRTYFGDSDGKDVQLASFPFISTIEPNIKDEVQIRVYHKGLATNFNNKLTINDKTYLLKDFLPVGYKEFVPNDDCGMLWPKDLDYVDVIVKPYDIKKGDNSLKIEAASVLKDGKQNFDDFFVDRVEVLINENTDDNYQSFNGYDVKQASNSWSKCD